VRPDVPESVLQVRVASVASFRVATRTRTRPRARPATAARRRPRAVAVHDDDVRSSGLQRAGSDRTPGPAEVEQGEAHGDVSLASSVPSPSPVG